MTASPPQQSFGGFSLGNGCQKPPAGGIFFPKKTCCNMLLVPTFMPRRTPGSPVLPSLHPRGFLGRMYQPSAKQPKDTKGGKELLVKDLNNFIFRAQEHLQITEGEHINLRTFQKCWSKVFALKPDEQIR